MKGSSQHGFFSACQVSPLPLAPSWRWKSVDCGPGWSVKEGDQGYVWRKADWKAPQCSIWLNNARFPVGVCILMSLFKSPDEILVCSGCSWWVLCLEGVPEKARIFRTPAHEMSKNAQVLRLLNSYLIAQTGNFACPERSAISGTVFLNSPSLRRMWTEGQSCGNETYLLSTACLLWQMPVTDKEAGPPGILAPKAGASETVRFTEAGALAVLTPEWQQWRQVYPGDPRPCHREHSEPSLTRDRERHSRGQADFL